MFKTIRTRLPQNPSSHPCGIDSAFYSSAENKLNTRLFSVRVSFRWVLKTQRLSLAAGNVGASCPAVLALGSRTWPGPRCHTLAFEGRPFLGPFSLQFLLFLCFYITTCCFHPFIFPCIKKKKNQVTKQFSLRVKVLQIQACYLYCILMNNSPTLMPCVWLTCNYGLYFFTATLNGILPWLFLKPSLEPLGHKRKGGLYRFHPVVVVFLPKA